MQNDIACLLKELDANSARAAILTRGLSNRQFNWRPQPGVWSMAEAVGHLNIINGGDLATLREAIEAGWKAKQTGTGPFSYGFLSTKFVSSMEPPAMRKFKAPNQYLPPGEASLDETIGAYQRICAEVHGLMESSSGLDLARVKTELPALPAALRSFVRMQLGARFALLTAHDRRHLWQATQVRNHPQFPQ